MALQIKKIPPEARDKEYELIMKTFWDLGVYPDDEGFVDTREMPKPLMDVVNQVMNRRR